MASNTYTKSYADASALTEAKLDAAFTTLQMDIAQSALMTTGSTSGQALISNGSGVAASFQAIPDRVGVGFRNVGLSASTSSGTLTVVLKTNNGTNPTALDPSEVVFSSSGASSAVGQMFTQTSSLSLTITASATLGVATATTASIYVYAVRQSSSTLRLAVSASGTLDYGAKQTTVAMASTADTWGTLYSNAPASTYPIKLLGWVSASHSNGTWNNIYSVNVTQAGSITGVRTTSVVAGVGGIAKSVAFADAINTSTTMADFTFNSNPLSGHSNYEGFTSASVNTGADTITVTSHGWSTGQEVKFTTPSTLPAPFVVGTSYYLIVSDANTLKFASTLANALNGTALDITTTGGAGTSHIIVQPSVHLTCTGNNPVVIECVPVNAAGVNSEVAVTTSSFGYLALSKDGSDYSSQLFYVTGGSPLAVKWVDFSASAGIRSYKLRGYLFSAGTLEVLNFHLIAYEMSRF